MIIPHMPINKIPKKLSSLVFTIPKTDYYKNETLDLTGAVVMAHYDDGTSADVTAISNISPANGTALTVYGENNVTAVYTYGDKTLTAICKVNVKVKIVTFASGSDSEIVEMVKAADEGKITLSNYWAVGDKRKVKLSYIGNTGVSEIHASQTVEFVLMDSGGKTLSDGGTCHFIVGMKDCLNEPGNIDSEYNGKPWYGTQRRKWCNSVFYNSIPDSIRSIFKKFKNDGLEDYFTLPALNEVFGYDSINGNVTQVPEKRFAWYKTSSNCIKKINGAAGEWYTRSLYSEFSPFYYHLIGANGEKGSIGNTDQCGLTMYGCI